MNSAAQMHVASVTAGTDGSEQFEPLQEVSHSVAKTILAAIKRNRRSSIRACLNGARDALGRRLPAKNVTVISLATDDPLSSMWTNRLGCLDVRTLPRREGKLDCAASAVDQCRDLRVTSNLGASDRSKGLRRSRIRLLVVVDVSGIHMMQFSHNDVARQQSDDSLTESAPILSLPTRLACASQHEVRRPMAPLASYFQTMVNHLDLEAVSF